MNIANVLAVCITMLLTFLMSVSQATNNNDRKLPRLSSFYQDDGSCSEHVGDATQGIIWDARRWNLTAPRSLVSPSSETNRNGTPLDVKPLNEFILQAQRREAIVVSGDHGAIAANSSVGLRLVMVVHDLVAEGPWTFSLQTIVAVRLCGSGKNMPVNTLYVGPRKGVYIRNWWRSRKSEQYVEGYRTAFALSVADAIEWAAGQAPELVSEDAH
jgi:hypothetical protein